MLAYTGYSRSEMVLSKVAALAGLGVALFPRGCDGRPDGVPKAHWISAAAMFLILAYFCYGFFHRARAKGHKEARRRAVIYALCGIAMPLSILVLAAGNRMRLGEEIPRLLRGCGGPDRIWCVVADRKSGAARPDARGRTLLALSRR